MPPPAGGSGPLDSTGQGGATIASGGTAATGGSSSLATGGSVAGPTGGALAVGGAPSGGSVAVAGGAPSGGGASGLGGLNVAGTLSASGGTPSQTAGAGGAPAPTLTFGFAPSTASWADAERAYAEWVSAHLEDCGDGAYRVRWENERPDATVSEGIGYGMLLTVAHGDRAAFDGLLTYYKRAPDDFGLMHWLRYGCDAHHELTYNEYPDNAAADADLDVAMALLQASCKWDASYGGEATRIINAVQASMVGQDGDVWVLQAGDDPFFDNNGCINYSYFSPAYYRAFAQHVPSQAEFWNQLAHDTYVLLERASHPSTGLVRNWGSTGGGTVYGSELGDCSFASSDSYGDDAARTPWRIATDYLWWGTPEAKAWADRVTVWVMTQPPQGLGQWYNLDGSFDTAHDGYADHTAITLGPWATGSMTHSQAAVDTLAAELLTIPTTPGSHDAEYFPRMLRALSLMTLAGRFSPCGGD